MRKRIVKVVAPGNRTVLSDFDDPELLRRALKPGTGILSISSQRNTVPLRINSYSKCGVKSINTFTATANDLPPVFVPLRDTRNGHIK